MHALLTAEALGWHSRCGANRGPQVALLLILGLSLLAAPALGSEAGRSVSGEAKQRFLQSWGQRLQTMQSLHMTFTQEKHLRLLRRPLEARGELWLKGETLVYTLKNVAGDTELVVRLDSDAIKLHYPLLGTLEVIERQVAPAQSLPWPFLTRDPAALTQEYDSSLSVAADLYTLRLIPRDARSPVAELRLTLQDFQPRLFVQKDKDGNRLVMHIAVFTPNAEISDARLDLRVPEGTQVVYPMRESK